MTETTLAIFAASLLGSPHCVAMCGPFVAFYSGASVDIHELPSRNRGTVHAAYNGGRLVAYLLLGFVAGSLGSALDIVGEFAGLGRLAAVVSGVLLCVWGVSTLSTQFGVRVPLLHPPRWMQSRMARVIGAVRAKPAVTRAAATGLATALLPCGWLYVFVAAATSTASPWWGAASMFVFWTGTLPLMVSAGFGLQRLAGPLRSRLPTLTAVMMVLIGLLTIAGRFVIHPDIAHHHAMKTVAAEVTR